MKRLAKMRWTLGGKLPLDLKHIFLVLLTVATVIGFSAAALTKTTYVITDQGEDYVVHTYAETPEEAMEEAGIALGPSDEYEVRQRGARVLVDVLRTVTVGVVSEGKTQQVTTTASTVAGVLDELEIDFDTDDVLSCTPDTHLVDGMTIEHTAVETTYVTAYQSIPFGTEYVEDDSIFAGKSLCLVAGNEGELAITYRCVYEDGVMVGMEEVSTSIASKPVNALVAMGTREVPIDVADMEYDYKNGHGIHNLGDYASYRPSVDNGETVTTFTGEEYSYEYRVYCDATAYTCWPDPPLSNGTASGRRAQMGVIASDWSVLPNGTICYVVAADGSWEYGYCIVGDNGDFGGPMVDLYMDTYDQCVNFGARQCYVYVLGMMDDEFVF